MHAQVTRIEAPTATGYLPQWAELMYNGASPELVRQAYEAFYASTPFEKTGHTQYYKRFMRNYVLTGDPSGATRFAGELTESTAALRTGNEWREAGPWHYDPEVAMHFEVQSPGAFHAYCVEQSASNPQVVWTGTATAGAWKTTDKGMHWSLMTRNLAVTSIYSVAIDPLDENTVYIGEESGGIWKTTNGGETWQLTGESAFNGQNHWVRDLRIAPNDNNVLFAATNHGFYRSPDAGATWVQMVAGNHMEIEFHPTDPQRVYVVGRIGNSTVFRRSTDGGFNFSMSTPGWPIPPAGGENQRTEIAVTPANPDRVYALAAGAANGGEGLFGIYVSDDAGETFSFQCCGNGPAGQWAAGTNPNILGWSDDGTGNGGQYYFDLALGASPTVEGRLFAAGIIIWRSLNAGASWEMNAHWVTWVGEHTQDRYVHADVHDIKFYETADGIDMWVACDGGIYYSSDQGDHIEPRMYGIHGTDFWGWQAGWLNGETMVGGTYHNGTHIKNGEVYHWGGDDALSGGWLAERGGDNFRGFVNPAKGDIGYHDGGAFRFSNDRFTRISGEPFDNSKLPNTGYWFGEYGNLEWDPRSFNRFYSPVGSQLWRTNDGGVQWDLVHNFGNGNLISVKVAPRDPNRIYVSHRQSGNLWRIWRTNDGGANWTEITIPSWTNGNNANRPIYLEVDAVNPDRVWAILIGGHMGNKVFESSSAGSNWQNITTPTIASEHVTSIAHQRGTEGGLYIGSTRRVFYKDDTMNDWEAYDNGLPAVAPASFMQANYCLEKIRFAGSRGVYECDFHTPSQVLAGFMADRLTINGATDCFPEPVHFVAAPVAACDGMTFEWSFPGGEVIEISEHEAWVSYLNEGSYDVTLTVGDASGQSDTFTWNNMISVINDGIDYPLTEDFNATFPGQDWRIVGSGNGGTWEHGSMPGTPSNGVAQFPNYWVDTNGEEDWLILPGMDFADVEEASFSFDVAYRQFESYVDGLEVRARTSESVDWIVLYSKYGAELSVPECYMWFWYDQGGSVAWRNETIDLTGFAGLSCVTLAFVNVGGYGNHIWVDNINLSSNLDSSVEHKEVNERMHVWPNPSRGVFNVRFPDQWLGKEFMVFDLTGRMVYEGRVSGLEVLDLSSHKDGYYLIAVPGLGHVRVMHMR